VAAVLLVCALPAYANVMETSLAVRDKLPAETLASLPDFVSRMEAMNSKVSVDASNGYYVVYNENDLKEIFGEDALLLPSPSGLLMISYKRGGTYRYWGMLHGLVVADTARKVITITKGGFISNSDLNVNIAGDEVQINVNDPARSLFKISRDGVYSQNEYFLGCESLPYNRDEESFERFCRSWLSYSINERRDCNREEKEHYMEYLKQTYPCVLSGIIMPNGAYLNITGEAASLSNIFLERFIKDEQFRIEILYSPSEEGQTPFSLTNISELSVEPGEEYAIKVKAQEGFFGSEYRIISKRIRFKSSTRLIIHPRNEDIIEIISREVKLIPEQIDVLVKTSETASESQASIQIFEGDFEIKLIDIQNGDAFVAKDSESYYNCLGDSLVSTCIYNDYSLDGSLHIEHKSITEPGILPFIAEIETAPIEYRASIKKVEIGTFESKDSLSKIKLVKEGIETVITFSGENITIEPLGRSWTDLGVSFTAKYFIPSEIGISALGVYDLIECKLPERKCYLNGVEVMGPAGLMAQFTQRCNSDSNCNSNQKCTEHLCVARANCEQVYENIASGNIDVLLVSDSYSRKEDFVNDIEKAIDPNGLYGGIFSVEPFKGNINKFKFHTVYGGFAPSNVLGGEPWNTYIRSYVKQCPTAEYGIVLSQKEFRATTSQIRENIRSIAWAEIGQVWISTQSDDIFSETSLHEWGHAFGGLYDEYFEDIQRTIPEGFEGKPNCLPKDRAINAWEQFPDIKRYAEQEKWEGCGGWTCGNNCKNWLRPSENSVMNHENEWLAKRSEPGWKAFNEPSEAQLIERLNAYS